MKKQKKNVKKWENKLKRSAKKQEKRLKIK